MNNDYYLKRISPKNVGLYTQLLEDDEISDLLKGRSLLYIVFSAKDEPMGAFVLSLIESLEGEDGKNLFLNSVYVAEKHRRQGVFSYFINKIGEHLSEKDISGIITQLMIPFNEEAEAALLSCGFTRINDGNFIYEAEFSEIDSISLVSTSFPKTESKIKSLAEAAPEDMNYFLSQFGNHFPAGLSPNNMPGKWIKDLSFIYVSDGSIKGFILSSSLPGNILYIGAVYMKKGHSIATAALIKRLLIDAKKSGRFKRIMFSAVSDESRKLGERLLKEAEAEVNLTVMRNYYYELRG